MAYDEERLLDEPLERLLDAEWVESYQPGGFHPVDIGDTFQADRYKVVRKLGHGSSSTVWLAGPRYVAMKIITSKASRASKEISINRSIRANNGARSHVVELLDNFRHVGPNGEHDCLVFEPMGPDVAACFERSIPYRHCGQICKQLLTALQCLHDREVAHSDTHPGNLLLSLTHPIENLSTGGRSVSAQIHGKRNPCAPDHIYEDRPLTEFCDHMAPAKFKLADFCAGKYQLCISLIRFSHCAAFLFNNPPERPIIAVALRAPEVVLQSTFDYRIDIWSFACYLFEVFTEQPLFTLPEFDPAGVQMISTLGLPPLKTFEKWLRRTRYFDANFKVIRTDVGQSETPLGAIHVGNTLERRFRDSRPPEMTAEECADLVHVLRSTLRYDPTTRPSTTKLLRLDWFHRAYDVLRQGARHKK
ncbi:hypothetical protein LTR22_027351 [Elasticomyces elasticus]|nr:hypothetical protein LTR22_027351 [Elasticomyces elasticus]